MEFSNNKQYVTVFDKRGKVETLATKFAALSASQIKGFFKERENKIPRILNMLALMQVLNDKIPTLNSHSLPKDAFFKLQFYKDFSEFQLQTLFEKICDDEDYLKYRVNLWTLIIRNKDVVNLQDGEAQYLSRVKKLPVEDFSEYNRTIFEVCEDVNRQFDGVPTKKIEESFNNTYSSDELRRLAEKYGFDIPQRLKKTEFTEFVKQILKSKRKLTVALGKEIDDMTVVQLNSLCEVHEITLSSNLKKNEIIFLLMFLIKYNKLTTSELKGITDDCGISPLEFTVDLDSVDNFGRGEAKEVIKLPSEEVVEEPVEEEQPDSLNDELLREIAKKLGLVIDGDKVSVADSDPEPVKPVKKEAPKQPVKKEVVKEPVKTSNGMTPAERLALARKKKQELAEQKRLEELAERKKLEELKKQLQPKPVKKETKKVEEPKEEIDVNELIKKLLNKQNVREVEEDLYEPEELENKYIEEEFDTDSYLEEEPDDLNEIDDELEESFEENEVEENSEDVDNFDDENDDAEDEEDSEELIKETLSDEVSEDIQEVTEEPVVETEEIVTKEVVSESTDEDSNENENSEEIVVESTVAEEEASEVQPEEVELKDESFDKEFDSSENLDVTHAISNPYYKNKKVNPKKKNVLKVFLYIFGIALVFCAGVFASKYIK